jgi:hypothetical protein
MLKAVFFFFNLNLVAHKVKVGLHRVDLYHNHCEISYKRQHA